MSDDIAIPANAGLCLTHDVCVCVCVVIRSIIAVCLATTFLRIDLLSPYPTPTLNTSTEMVVPQIAAVHALMCCIYIQIAAVHAFNAWFVHSRVRFVCPNY